MINSKCCSEEYCRHLVLCSKPILRSQKAYRYYVPILHLYPQENGQYHLSHLSSPASPFYQLFSEKSADTDPQHESLIFSKNVG